MPIQLSKRLFTVHEYHRMGQTGILSEDDRVELIEGEIVHMAPIGSRHAACVDRLNQLFSLRVTGRAIVRVQNPVLLSEYSEPQPDLALLRPRHDFYAAAHPGPQDVLLVVEVADTSAGIDRAAKMPLYARAGIPEAWLVDLQEERLEVHFQPLPRLSAGASLWTRHESRSSGNPRFDFCRRQHPWHRCGIATFPQTCLSSVSWAFAWPAYAP